MEGIEKESEKKIDRRKGTLNERYSYRKRKREGSEKGVIAKTKGRE